MSLTAPPPVQDPVPCDVDDAVIKEARRRARRRRWSYGTVVVALATVTAFVAWYPAPPQQSASAAAAAEGSHPAGGPGPDAQLVARFGAVHGGWVLVYSDAYVIMYQDVDAHPLATRPRSMPMGDARFVMRRLTDDGLANVRSGGVPLSSFLTDPMSVQEMWAEPEFRPYDNTLGYIACDLGGNTSTYYHASTGVLTQLPVAAQALLRGTEQTYNFVEYDAWMHPGGSMRPLDEGIERGTYECFALTNDIAHALALMSTDQGRALALDHPSINCATGCLGHPGPVTLVDVHGAEVTLLVHTALPDRVLIARGG